MLSHALPLGRYQHPAALRERTLRETNLKGQNNNNNNKIQEMRFCFVFVATCLLSSEE